MTWESFPKRVGNIKLKNTNYIESTYSDYCIKGAVARRTIRLA